MEKFRAHLEAFAVKHRQDVQRDPVFRQQFQKMCGVIGVDPLASSKGFWAEALGIGDFYFELGLNIIDVCMRTRAQNGGLIEVRDLQRQLALKLSQSTISEYVYIKYGVY